MYDPSNAPRPAYLMAPQQAQAMYPTGYDPHQARPPGERIAGYGQMPNIAGGGVLGGQPRPGFDFLSGQRGGGLRGYSGPMPGSPEWQAARQAGERPILDWMQAQRAAGIPGQMGGQFQPGQLPQNTGIVPPHMGGSPVPQMQHQGPGSGFAPPMQPQPRPMNPGFDMARRPNPQIRR